MKFRIETGKKNTVLRAKSEAVAPSEYKQYLGLAADMIKYIKDPENLGVGLAAPQIGVNKRIIVVSLLRSYEDENFRTIAMINPEIVEHAEETECDSEGCLSVPGEWGDVERWKRIKVSYIDTSLKPQTMLLQGLAARIVQHEVDHLDGVLFTDRVGTKEVVPVLSKNL